MHDSPTSLFHPLSEDALWLLEDACCRFEARLKARTKPTLEDFLKGVEPPQRAIWLRELLLLELEYRRGDGETPPADEYISRFPHEAALIAEVVSLPPPAENLTSSWHPHATAESTSDIGDTGSWIAGSDNGSPLPTIPGYEILGELGRGGMGVVYKARDTALNRLVALKMVLAGQHATPERRARLRAEAEAAARVQHPHVAQVFTSGEYDGCPYFVQEFIDGPTLAQQVGKQPQPPRDAARLVMLLARAVHLAHQRDIVHRDLKPTNVLLAPPSDEPALNTVYGCPKVADFGLARYLDGTQDLTGSEAILGTPPFMSPEQAEGAREVGPTTDVYALGALLYWLLTGLPPFQGKSTLQTLEKVRTQPVRPPREVRPDIPSALEAICLRCLAKAPADRYPTALALSDDLRRFLGGEPVPQTPRLPQSSRRRVVLAVLVFLPLLVLLGIAGYWVRQHQPAGSPTHAATPSSEPVTVVTPSLSGELIVRVWTDEGNKRGLRIGTDFGAVPIAVNEMLQLEARLDEPAYIYLLWIDGQGVITPLYPWNPENEIVIDDIATPPPPQQPKTPVRSPHRVGQGWRADNTPGLDTILLLARREPLPANFSLKPLLADVKPAPLGPHDEVVIRGFHRGRLIPEGRLGEYRGPQPQAEAIRDRLLQLADNLQNDFELIRAVQFAHVQK